MVKKEGDGPKMKTPPAIQALVIISKLDPQPGDSGVIECPRCAQKSFRWWKETAIGKLSGACPECGLILPRA